MPVFRPSFLCVVISALALALSAASPAQPQEATLAPGQYRWLGQGARGGTGDGPIYMVISIEKQMIHVYSGDRLIGLSSVSTGMKGHRTPTGDYPILQKRQWHRSNLYSNAPMPYMQRLTWTGIALHAGHNPGYPASHGCIRLPYAFARDLFALTKMGTLVEVTQARLTAALKLDPLVLSDPGSAVVSFGAGKGPPLALPSRPDAEDAGLPMLEIDPAIFGSWGRR
ncbi:L,D-transpeptidase family protein [Sphingobium sp. CAP-1]|uniref:L,D-transpeptidase family protein n=1 Tax=Sphingobium sp. CAP-1 TaxID=2676077 RepID=UPI0012BB389A|nr:L,D-transpeptidase family protein [Sphingobium sp. CAP-1]QGP80962.1 L,D-transpeptidase family protein [Sphingobium sp. CAP-1]